MSGPDEHPAAAHLLALGGGPGGSPRRLVATCSGIAGLACGFWLVTRFGVGALVGVTLGVMAEGFVTGGYFTDTPLWVLGPTMWADTASTPLRAAIACLASLAVTAVAVRLWRRAVVRQVAAGGVTA